MSAARGVYTENGIIIQADHRYLNIDQIADHEAFHDYAANNPGLVRQIERAIVEQYSREEFDAIMDKYLKNLRGVYDLPEHASGQEVAEAYGIVKEEICADAYAGINFFGAHAEKYRSEAQAVLQERKVTTPGSETAAATQRRTGPPERYSYGGVNANTADQKTLAHAQELQMQGEDDERVRKETGWHTGMEGKLRFEIDDSKMKYHRGGDAAFSRSHPDYAEYQKLVDKMLTGSAEAWKPEDQERLQSWTRPGAESTGGLSERVESGDATLEDVIDHEELFQAYPQLRNVRVEFKELPGNTQGYFSPSENKIALDSEAALGTRGDDHPRNPARHSEEQKGLRAAHRRSIGSDAGRGEGSENCGHPGRDRQAGRTAAVGFEPVDRRKTTPLKRRSESWKTASLTFRTAWGWTATIFTAIPQARLKRETQPAAGS
ncbi:MAG: LPD23 domain-containing protein [Oscillospiraceae bacterium]